MAKPRILTFNFHEPYLCLMAKIGLPLHVGVYEEGPLARPWMEHMRPIPPGLTLLREHEWRRELFDGAYDVIIAQNENNALDVYQAPGQKLLLCHNRATFLRTTIPDDESTQEQYQRMIALLRQHFQFVFISPSKQADYGIEGPVVLPGIDVDEWGGYTGETPLVLRVGNMMRERDRMFDVAFQDACIGDYPTRVVGTNPGIAGSEASRSFDELLDLYRTSRCYLHVSREEFEDGYNLAMLEAMACGMPIVALANETSPLTDGHDGFVSRDAAVLHARIGELMSDLDLARAMGARARETVAAKFPIARFAERWREIIEQAAAKSLRTGPPADAAPKDRLNILLHYAMSPLTTGRYFEEALRPLHSVLTAGFRTPEAVLELWGFHGTPPAYEAQQIDLPLDCRYDDIVREFPPGYQPDLYLWVDSGPKDLPENIGLLGDVPKLGYLIDTHIAPELRIAMARQLDCVFLAQRAQVAEFRAAGVEHVYWLPLGCSLQLHRFAGLERHYDLAYVGSLKDDAGDARRQFIASLGELYPNHYIGQAWPHEMAAIYAQAKIVVNASVAGDINMRVFEALASGALLITDAADGIDELFEDGVHLRIYRTPEEAEALVAYYLEHTEERERIARAGWKHVRQHHAYHHRIKRMLEIAHELFGPLKRSEDNAPDLDPYYQCRRPELLPYIPRNAEHVFEIGCAAGAFAREMKRKRGVKRVSGVELTEQAASYARHVLDDVQVGNIETMELPHPPGSFDAIVAADVLEHLIDPTATLRRLGEMLKPDGVVVMSIPNIRYHEVIAMLGRGGWTYMDQGLLDRTHQRFFTRGEIEAMIYAAGLEPAHIEPLSAAGSDVAVPDAKGTVTCGCVQIHHCTAADLEGFRTYQYCAIARRATGDGLAKAREALREGDFEEAYTRAYACNAADPLDRLPLMAVAASRLGRIFRAEQLYREALEHAPENAVFAGELGIVLVAQNRRDEARPYLEQALAVPENAARIKGAYGLLKMADGAREEAYQLFQEALEETYETVALMPQYLDLADKLGRLGEALPLVVRFSTFYPGNRELALEHANLLVRLGRRPEAMDRLDQLLLVDPECEPARRLREALAAAARG